MATREQKQRANAADFPIFSYEDYDFSFSASPWPIGLKSTYPTELKRRIAAAFISLQLGNSGIDYTYKRYLKDKDYQVENGSRIDLRITNLIAERLHILTNQIERISQTTPDQANLVICEWTFFRAPFSINFLVSCAIAAHFLRVVQ